MGLSAARVLSQQKFHKLINQMIKDSNSSRGRRRTRKRSSYSSRERRKRRTSKRSSNSRRTTKVLKAMQVTSQ